PETNDETAVNQAEATKEKGAENITKEEEKSIGNVFNPKSAEGMKDLAELLGSALTMFLELYKSGDYGEAWEVAELGLSGKDPIKIQEKSKADYGKIIQEGSFPFD